MKTYDELTEAQKKQAREMFEALWSYPPDFYTYELLNDGSILSRKLMIKE